MWIALVFLRRRARIHRTLAGWCVTLVFRYRGIGSVRLNSTRPFTTQILDFGTFDTMFDPTTGISPESTKVSDSYTQGFKS